MALLTVDEVPEVPEEYARRKHLDETVQAKANQRYAAGYNAAAYSYDPLAYVVEQREDKQPAAVADEG